MRSIVLFILLDYALYIIIKLNLIELEVNKILFLSGILGLVRVVVLSLILFGCYLIFRIELKNILVFCSLLFPLYILLTGFMKNVIDTNLFYNDFLPFITTWLLFTILQYK